MDPTIPHGSEISLPISTWKGNGNQEFKISPTCRAALIYAAQYNFRVFPSKQDKKPLIQDWNHQASKDPEIIKQWWTQWPNANVSMVTGSASGTIILDVDVKNGEPGFDSLRELELKYGDFKTPTTLSPSGGQHLYFIYDGAPLKRKIRFLPGLDFMAEDSYVLLPPSIGTNGKPYRWEASSRIGEVAFAPLPEWLQKLASSSNIEDNSQFQSKKGSSFWLQLAREGVTQGQRNQSVTQLAGHLLRRYVDPFLAQELILMWNESRNNPPLPKDEIVKTITSIAIKEGRRRQGAQHD